MTLAHKLHRAYAHSKSYLVNTRHTLVVLAPSIGPLRPGCWYISRVRAGFVAGLPLTRRTHLILGVAL